MILDKLLQTAAVSQAGTLGSAVNSDVYDLKAVKPLVGEGERIRILWNQDTAATNFTTWTVILQMDDNEAFGSATAVKTWTITRNGTISAAGVFDLGVLPNGITERWIRFNCTPSAGTQGVGSGTFALVKDMKEGIAPYPTPLT